MTPDYGYVSPVSMGGQCPMHHQPLGTCCQPTVRYVAPGAQLPTRIKALEGLIERVLAIQPEDHATTSRDYGRGFAAAIRQVREVLSDA